MQTRASQELGDAHGFLLWFTSSWKHAYAINFLFKTEWGKL